MGKHAEKKAPSREAEEAMQVLGPGGSVSAYGTGDDTGEPKPGARRSTDWRAAKDRVVGLLAGTVRWLGLLFASVLVLHVVFVVGEANVENGIVAWAADWSGGLALGFHDLFQPSDPKLLVLVNYGIAAVFWLVVSSVAAKLVRRIGGLSS
ncbi:hypothetical protein [Saccharomonospora cyanea]|uniref:Uncharacterized protein n=1 Tax=Saccharomonospora cyanea NA-134 TaxID=882082 RepID=H5XL77_9PSEU|nr:hypothetical protein [Saccharomonospora cyanea]EHR63585.1 hypothetical protein SaccyDRAFT_4780 [Saccharomonospora cyanea NA-134]